LGTLVWGIEAGLGTKVTTGSVLTPEAPSNCVLLAVTLAAGFETTDGCTTGLVLKTVGVVSTGLGVVTGLAVVAAGLGVSGCASLTAGWVAELDLDTGWAAVEAAGLATAGGPAGFAAWVAEFCKREKGLTPVRKKTTPAITRATRRNIRASNQFVRSQLIPLS
jgi:hypothetical protein